MADCYFQICSDTEESDSEAECPKCGLIYSQAEDAVNLIYALLG